MVEVKQNREVKLALLQARHVLVGLAVGEVQLDTGAAVAKDLHRAGGEGHRRGREGPEAQPPARPSCDRFEFGLRVAEAGEHRVRVGDERLGGLGEAHPSWCALEQRDTRVARQGRHLLGHGGGRERHRLGCR